MTGNNIYKDEDYAKIAEFLTNNNASLQKQKQQFDENKIKECTKIWAMLDEMKDIEQFDTDKAWNKLYNKLEHDKLIDEPKVKTVPIRRMMAIAASIILIFALGLLTKQFLNTSEFTIANTATEAKQVILPDGSRVFLNKDAQLTYNKEFNENIREVELKGEAFFEIERNEQKPFIVNVNNAQVKVLGTSFNVRQSGKKQLEVIVRTGKVQLCDCKVTGENIILTKGEKGVLMLDELSKQTNDKVNYLAWMNKKLSFKSSPLYQVVDDINASYHANIHIEGTELENMLITTTFDSLTVDEVIESLVLTLNINVEFDGKKTILVKH